MGVFIGLWLLGTCTCFYDSVLGLLSRDRKVEELRQIPEELFIYRFTPIFVFGCVLMLICLVLWPVVFVSKCLSKEEW